MNTFSHYGREGVYAVKYSQLERDFYHQDNLLGDLVDHWMRHEGWDEKRDEMYPEDDIWFRGKRDDAKVVLREMEGGLILEFGVATSVRNSIDYVESVWMDRIREVLERNSGEELADIHLEQRTNQLLSHDNQVRAL